MSIYRVQSDSPSARMPFDRSINGFVRYTRNHAAWVQLQSTPSMRAAYARDNTGEGTMNGKSDAFANGLRIGWAIGTALMLIPVIILAVTR